MTAGLPLTKAVVDIHEMTRDSSLPDVGDDGDSVRRATSSQ
jgi:hypothetical protein